MSKHTPLTRGIDGLISDYDGVLLEYWPRAWQAISAVLHHLGLNAIEESIDKEEFRKQLHSDSFGRALFSMIPDACKDYNLVTPTKREIIEALRSREITHGNPLTLSDKTWETLRALHAWRTDPSHRFRFMGILSDRTYTTAWHHMNGAQQELFLIMDVMQFSRVQQVERDQEKCDVRRRAVPCEIRIQSYRKPDARSFQNFAQWAQEAGHLKEFTNQNPFMAIYTGDTLLDALGVKNANKLFRANNTPMRLLFVPTCIHGPILTDDEWKQVIGKPQWATQPIHKIENLETLISNYNNEYLPMPNLG